MRPLYGIRHGGNRKERVPIFREMPFAFQNRNEPEKQRHTLYREAIKKREIQKTSGSWQGFGGLEPCARYAGFSMAEIGNRKERMPIFRESQFAFQAGINRRNNVIPFIEKR